MAETLKKTIHDVAYESAPFPPLAALGLAARLAKMLGPTVISALPVLLSSPGSLLDQNLASLTSAVQGAFLSLQPKEFQALCLDLLRQTWQVNNGVQLQIDSDASFNLAFREDFGAVWSVLWLALEANDFFVGAGIGKRLKAKLTPAPSPAPSTPPSSLS